MRLTWQSPSMIPSVLRQLGQLVAAFCLHIFFLSLGLVSHIYNFAYTSLLPLSESRALARLESHKKAWAKTPTHLAVVFVSQGHARIQQSSVVSQRAQDVTRLVRWAQEIGVETVSVYDERGLSLSRPSAITRSWTLLADPRSLAVFKGEVKSAAPEILAACLSLSTLDVLEPTETSKFRFVSRRSPASSRLTLSLLDKEDGQSYIAHVGRVLAMACAAGHIDATDIRQPLLSEKLGSDLISTFKSQTHFCSPYLIETLSRSHSRTGSLARSRRHAAEASWVPPMASPSD
jgi:undecaprenyl pyrophosphate synthase